MRRQIRMPRMSLKKTADAISLFLSEPNNMVMFFDEGRFGLQPVIGRCWIPKGKKQSAKIKTGYKFFYLYAGVSPTNGESFMLLLPWVNTDIMNVYLNELSKAYQDKTLMIIMDQAGWHKSKTLIVPENIHIEYLPPYSPELNPVEKLWLWLRRHVCRNRLFKSEEELIEALTTMVNRVSNTQASRLCHCSYLS